MRTYRAAFVVILVLFAHVANAGGFDFESPRIVLPKLTLTGANRADTQCLFDDAGVVSGDPGCTYNKATDSLSLTGALYLSALDAAAPAGTGIDVERMGGPRIALKSYLLDNADVVALGAVTTGNVTVTTLAAKVEVHNLKVVITSAAVGPTTVTMSCGRTGAAYTDYLTASNAKIQDLKGEVSGDRGANLTGYDVPNYSGTTPVICQFVSTGANLNTVTGFAARVVLTYSLNP